MRKFLWLLLLAFPIMARADVDAIQGYCTQGGTKAATSGLSSTNNLQGVVSACTVTVYFTGTTNLAPIFSNNTGTVLPNPFTANSAISVNPGSWIFWATNGVGYDVVLSGGGGNPNCTTPPNCFAMPITLVDLKIGGSGGGGGGGNLNPGQQFNLVNYVAPGTGTTGGPTPGLSAVGTNLGGLSTTDTSYQFMKQPFGSPNPGVPFCAGTGYFSTNIADQVTCNIYTTTLPVNQGITGIGWFDWLLDNGRNENQNGYFFKPGTNMFNLVSQNNSPGSLNSFNINSFQYSLGDSFNIFNIANCYGGTSAQGDEGCENSDEWLFEGVQEFTATISSGASTGATSLILNSPSVGNGTQGAGRYLIKTSGGTITAGSIVALAGGGTPITATGSGTSWPVSTVNTTASSPSTWGPGTATVTPASMTGISNGTVVCVVDGGDYDQARVTATTGSTFTANFNHPHSAGAIVAAGGLCGYGIAFTSDNVTGSGYFGTMRWVFPVIVSTSATSLKFWNGHAGNYSQGYTGSWNSTTNSAYTLFPLAEVTHVNNGTNNLSPTITISDNTVAWANGDTVEEPIYFTLTTQHGNNNNFRTFPSGQMNGRTYQFGGRGFAGAVGIGGVGVSAEFEHVVNSNSTAFYNPANNKFPPNGIEFSGPWTNSIIMDQPPFDAILIGATGSVGTLETIADLSTGGRHDHFFYVGTDGNPGSGYWGVSTNGGSNGNVGPFIYLKDGSITMTSGVVTMDGFGDVFADLSVASTAGGIGQYQNILFDSAFQQFSTFWSTSCGPPVTTPNTTDVFDPFDTQTALKVVGAASSPGGGCGSSVGNIIQSNVSIVSGHSYSASMWQRGAAGGEQTQTNVAGAAANFVPPVTLTTSWKQVVTNFTATNTGAKQFIVDLLTPSATIYLWGGQICDLTQGGCMYVTSTSSNFSPPTLGEVLLGVPQNPSGSGVTSITASSPIVVSAATGAVTVSCPTCGVSSTGTNVTVNGGSILGAVNLGTGISADASFLAAPFKITGSNSIVEVQYGSAAQYGVFEMDGSTLVSSGGVASVSATYNAPTATALASAPTTCVSANQLSQGIGANGNAMCSTNATLTSTLLSLTGNAIRMNEGAAGAGAPNVDILWADASQHVLGVNLNNGGTNYLTYAAGSGVSGNCVKFGSNGVLLVDAGSTCAGAVSSVSNSNGTLTVSPTTGAVVASLNLAHANTWTALQTFSSAISTSGLTLSGITGSIQCAQISATGVVSGTGSACGSGSGAVSSVSNSDASLTISPTTGAVVASLNTAKANVWTGQQTLSSVAGTALSEIAAPGAVTGTEVLWGDSTKHRLGVKYNGGGTVSYFSTTSGAATAGNCVQFGANGIDLTDAGAACGTGGGGGSGTVTVVGAGSLTSTALVTGGGAQAIQTPNTSTTLDSSGNLSVGGQLTVANPGGGVGAQMFLTQEGTAPTGLIATGQDNCYASSAQHGILCNFNAGTTLPLVQGPVSDTSGHVATYSGSNGGLLADSGVVGANLVVASSPGAGVAHFAGSTQTVTSSAVALTDMATQASDTFLINATGGSAKPTAVAAPTSGTNGCAGTSDALSYNTSTHTFGCTTISGGGGGLPSGTTGQTVYYATGGTTGTATSAITIGSASVGTPVGINQATPLFALDTVGTTSHLWVASVSLTTSGSNSAIVTTINVTNTTNLPSTGGVFLIGGTGGGTQEYVKCTAASGTTISGCTRGYWGTTGAAQSNGTPVFLVEQATQTSATTQPSYALLSNGLILVGGGNTSGVLNNASNMSNDVALGTTIASNGMYWGVNTASTVFTQNQGGGFVIENNGAKVVALTDGATPAVLTSNTTITATSLTTTGIVLNTIPNTGQSSAMKGECHIMYSQSTAANTVTFGVGMSATPTNLWIQNPLIWNGTAISKGTPTTITSTAVTAITSAITPAASATVYTLDFYFSIQTTNGGVFTLYGDTQSGTDALVVNAGSWCGWEL